MAVVLIIAYPETNLLSTKSLLKGLLVFVSLIFLLVMNEKIRLNKMSSLFLKSLKFLGFALLLSIVVNLFLRVEYTTDQQETFNKFAENVPMTLSSAILQLPLLILVFMISGPLSYIIRKRVKPNKVETTDHLLP